jgi:hypothetical protein
MTDCRYVWRPLSYLSRRDNRTQPVVLTPGSDKESARPEGAEDTVPLAHLSMQALGTTLYRPFRARSFWVANPGLKPRAESCRPFGTNCGKPDCTLRPVHQIPAHSGGPNVVQIPIIDSTWKSLVALTINRRTAQLT